MKPIAISQSELSQTIKNLGLFEESTSTTINEINEILEIDFDALTLSSKTKGIDIDDIIEEAEKDPKTKNEIAKANEWIAENFYADEISIKYLRLKKGYSQKELASLLKTKQSHISRIENGTEDIRLSTAKKMAKVLDTDIQTIADFIETD